MLNDDADTDVIVDSANRHLLQLPIEFSQVRVRLPMLRTRSNTTPFMGKRTPTKHCAGFFNRLRYIHNIRPRFPKQGVAEVRLVDGQFIKYELLCYLSRQHLFQKRGASAYPEWVWSHEATNQRPTGAGKLQTNSLIALKPGSPKVSSKKVLCVTLNLSPFFVRCLPMERFSSALSLSARLLIITP